MTSVFVDREQELRALQDTLAGVVIVEGEAGIGKTALLDRFVASRTGVRVLRAGGDETEADIPFAAADQLLRSAGSATDALRAGQHVAIGLELLELMTAEPSLVVVDDVHLIDAESLRALLFAARRLAGSATVLVLAVRGNAAATLAEGWLALARQPIALRALAAEHVQELCRGLGVEVSAEAAARLRAHTDGNPLHLRAVLAELPADGAWQLEERPLPVPSSYADLVRAQLDRCDEDVVAMVEAAAVLGTRARLAAAVRLAGLPGALSVIDAALDSGLVRLHDQVLAFSHPLARAAVYESLPQGRRAALNARAAKLVSDPGVALRHRVEAALEPDPALIADLEAHARASMARGAWAAAVSSFTAASRLSTPGEDRERFAAEAIEAMMYAGDGATARRLVAQTAFAEGPRRDSVLAYLAIFDGDVATAQTLLARAWERRGDDSRLAATVAQRSAFLSASRLRGTDAIEWARRAVELAPQDVTTARLVAASLALGSSFTGRREQAHAALDRWDDGGSGFILRTLKGNLLIAEGDLPGARAVLEAAAADSLERGLLVVAAISLSVLTQVEYLAGAWDSAVVSGERAISLAVESEDQWVIGQAHWRASLVPAARGDWAVAEAHVRAIQAQAATFERHIVVNALATAMLAASRERPAEALRALDAIAALRDAEGTDDPAFVPWHALRAHTLVDVEDAAAEPFIDDGLRLAGERRNPLLRAQLLHARGRLQLARRDLRAAAATLRAALAVIEPLETPYERALIELTLGQALRRAGERRAAAETLTGAHERFAAVGAHPALAHCEIELAACGLTPTARKARDRSALTPQEVAVTRLVVSGMTNREVAGELMLSAKTVEFHLSNIYGKLGVRTRSQLRARARANELPV